MAQNEFTLGSTVMPLKLTLYRIDDGVRGLKTNFSTTIYSGWQANNTTISANFDDFQIFTPISLPNDFMSFGGIFYPSFVSLTEQILNDG